MDVQWYPHRIILDGKNVTTLDQFVLGFSELLAPFSEYVIVSGYVSIIFGRSRGTEDIDILIPWMKKETFSLLFSRLEKEGYYFLNAEDWSGLYEMLVGRMGIRAARKETVIPNIEIKFVKDDYDRYALDHRTAVEFSGNRLFISPLELQIAYKLHLGSDKDIEDAVYLWDIFKENLDTPLLKKFMQSLRVRGDDIGIVV
jgi:hypothetical protein